MKGYDGSWRAIVNVERIGPHFIGLDISAFSGDLEIRLSHLAGFGSLCHKALALDLFTPALQYQRDSLDPC